MSRPLGVWLPAVQAGTGTDVFTRRLCAALRERDIRTDIDWLPHRAEWCPVTVPRRAAPEWATVVHVNSWLPLRFWPAGIPVVATVHHLVHDPAYAPFRSPLQALYHAGPIRRRERAAIHRADVVTTVSDYVRQTVVNFSGRRDIVTVPNWVDCERYCPPEAPRPPAADGSFRILIAGRWSRRKGSDLLRAFVAALGPGFDVSHAGGAKGAPSASGVRELGRIGEDRLVAEYQRCDAVVSLSRYEGFGYTALEGMACGRPFVGFRSSGLAEVAREGAAMLVDVDDVEALAGACRTLASNPALVAAMGRHARTRALEFQRDAMLERYLSIYRGLTALPGHR